MKRTAEAFLDNFTSGTEGMNGLNVGAAACCEICNPDGVDQETLYNGDDCHFSKSACETCGCPLGGDRYAGHYFDENDEVCHVDVCVDCLLYIANGDLPIE